MPKPKLNTAALRASQIMEAAMKKSKSYGPNEYKIRYEKIVKFNKELKPIANLNECLKWANNGSY